MKIRPYKKEDRSQIRDIAWETAFMGESADVFFDDREFFSDFLTLYFTDYEPESCFVAEENGRVEGYLIGSKNVKNLKRILQQRILWYLVGKFFQRMGFLSKKNITFISRCVRSFFKREFKVPDFSSEYPATLHINIKKENRRLGMGSRLMAAYLEYLKKEKVAGICLATMSERAGLFFKKEGFELLHHGRRSYFRHLLGRDISVYIFGKKLPG